MQCLKRSQMLTFPLSRLLQSSVKCYSAENQKVFTFYTNENCSMCSYFKRRMDAYLNREKPGWTYEERKINSSPKEVFEKYKNDVPVLVCNDTVLIKHKFSAKRLQDRMSDVFPAK
ncbi:unnamed protein product [Cylicocyclus nassatus]|uniref:Glutaredoxin-like protein n=1 Tax=Cylicocyclus nassatus TaxID=53992 RepID=A0AA36GVL1_CYLNA|nr:unnamed protein product [Cylicocyclus nassatus]